MREEKLFQPGHTRVDDSFHKARLAARFPARPYRDPLSLREQWKDTIDPPPAIERILGGRVAGPAPAPTNG